jgi:hypothetical protein
LSRDPAAKQLLIHLNKKRSEAGHEQFIVADRESRFEVWGGEARLAADAYHGLIPVDAEHLMVKANVMEEVEKEFQAQVRLAWDLHPFKLLIRLLRNHSQLEEFTFRHTDEEEVKKGKTAA